MLAQVPIFKKKKKFGGERELPLSRPDCFPFIWFGFYRYWKFGILRPLWSELWVSFSLHFYILKKQHPTFKNGLINNVSGIQQSVVPTLGCQPPRAISNRTFYTFSIHFLYTSANNETSISFAISCLCAHHSKKVKPINRKQLKVICKVFQPIKIN